MDTQTSNKIRAIATIAIFGIIGVHSINLYKVLPGNSFDTTAFTATYFIENLFSHGLFRSCLPFFFMFSGFFYFYSFRKFDSFGVYYRSSITKRLRTIVLPYLLWNILNYLVFAALQLVPFFRNTITFVQIYDMNLWETLIVLFYDPIPYPIWYLRDVMIMFLLSPILYFLIKRLKLTVLVIFLLCWLLEIDLIILRPKNLFFFTLGSSIYLLNLQIRSIRPKYLIFPVLLWIVSAVGRTFVGYYSDSDVLYSFTYIMTVGSGVVVFWHAVDFLPETIIAKLVKANHYVFFIFAAHEPLMTVIKGIIFKFGSQNPSIYMINYILAPLLTIPTILFSAYLAGKFFSKPYKILTGGR